MPEAVLQIANSWLIWGIAIAIIVIVLIQSLLYIRLSFRAADQIGFPREKCVRGLRAGAISAIGPSIAIFIVMVGMMSVVGGPITWLRLSIIGAAPTELTAATIGAEALGVKFGSADYDLTALATSWWTMTINGTGWLICAALFTHKLEGMREKMGGGDPVWLAIMSGGAMLGCFGFLNSRNIVSGLRELQSGLAGGGGPLYAAIGGLLGMVLMMHLAKKLTWLREYTLGIAMLIGMAVAVILV
ncbi:MULTISPECIES: DUF5058 family protein [Aminobacterium]|uniref:DUF5058 family protein n=1 Tax=Aminobacterium TaxID=81466 RepID=UPI0004668CBC|nr:MULTISPECIES: DUF5058 family protein [Aminobacterium]